MARNENLVRDEQEVEYVPIKVHAGILIHIGAGIYHSVAGAIKELVSNSYDADATEVIISTDYPRFEQIKVIDDGTGMTRTRLRQAMATIGSGLKGVLDPNRMTPKYERPIIGKLGIGLMALSQVCSEATIESQAEGSNTKFVAKLNFAEFKKRAELQTESLRLDVLRERYGGEREMKTLLKNPKTSIETKEEIETLLGLISQASPELTSIADEIEKEQLGYCMLYPDLPAVPGESGTTITLTNIDPTVRNLLRDAGRAQETLPKQYKDREYTWATYCDELNKNLWKQLCELLRADKVNYQLLPKYHQFLWELALMTPIQYLPSAPVLIKPNLLRQKKKELDDFNFSLLVDNRQLLKPILLPSGAFTGKEQNLEETYDYFLETFNFDGDVDEQRLKYYGYIFWQRKQVQPSVIRGLQIYIRNVGIGLYDHTLMNFSTVNITSRAGQMSGEIYVEEGLERALNVDRNSFRVTDDHYVALQQHVWNLLGSATRGDGIIGKSVDSYWLRKERSEDKEHKRHVKDLRESVRRASNGQIDILFYNRKAERAFEIIDDRILVYDLSPQWPKSKQERRFYQQILIPAEAALAAGVHSEQIVKLLESTLLSKRSNV